MTSQPFVKLPVAVTEAVTTGAISMQAGWLYVALASHLSNKRADSDVWPSRDKLASMMGFSRPASVDRYLAELITVGLVEKRQTTIGGMRARNRYTLAKTISARSTPARTTEPPAETLQNPSSPRGTPQRTTLYAPADYVVRQGVQELDEAEPDEDELQLRRRTSSSSGASVRKTTRAKQKDDDETIARNLIVEHAALSEAGADEVIAWWRHVGDIKWPGKYATAIIRDDGEDQLADVALGIAHEDRGVAANLVMESLWLADGVDRDAIGQWVDHALNSDAPFATLLPALNAATDDEQATTEAIVTAIRNLCPTCVREAA